MEIHEAIEGKEHIFTDDGGEIICPVCGTIWFQEEEDDVTFGDCDHLRFVLHSDRGDDFDFSNEWDSKSFVKLVEEAREEDEDDELDILDIVAEIKHHDVDKGILYVWYDDPLSQPWALWGYKSN